MPPTKPSKNPAQSAKLRPGQDMVTAKRQASQFPALGTTLPSYKYDPRDRHGWQAQTLVKNGRRTIKRLLLVLGVLVLIVGGFIGAKFIYNAHKIFGGNILGVLTPTRLKGEDQGRVNILLAGNSADDPGHEGASLTDSIMIVSLDTRNNKAFLLSVPRDLWVHIPDDGHQKINAVYNYGQSNNFSQSDYPDGGMGQLEQVIQEDFGLNIDYYALVDYSALRDSVNAVGGIDFTVKSDDPRGLYDPSIDYKTHGPLVRLSNGVHRLNGQQALDLARARGDSYGSYGFPAADFDRTDHQRQLLVDLKNKVTTPGVIANPAKIASLSDALGNNVKTDFKTSEVRRLFDLSKKISSKNIQSLSLDDADGKNLLASYNAPGGQSALIPAAGVDDYSDIQAFLNRHTSSNPVVQEGAKVVVLNATDSNGLANKQKSRLTAKSLIVSKVGTATTAQAQTTIIDNSGGQKPATRNLLGQLYGHNFTTVNPYANIYDADFIILLGTDQVNPPANSGQ